MEFSTQPIQLLSLMALVTLVTACGRNQVSQTKETTSRAGVLSGALAIDGSSTVFPIAEAMAEEFQKAHPQVRVTVGISGTGGGFKKFCAGETDISNASRPIKQSEIEACQKAGIEYVELPIAFDAISVVVNPKNTWAGCLTTKDLKKIWQPAAQKKISNWKQVRAEFPNQRLNLYGPGTDSGTFDYFTKAINGKEGASRGDFTATEDDNVIVQGVSNDPGALGYFGLAYLEENRGKLKGVKIDDENPNNGNGCIEPSEVTVEAGTYQPLARPIFIYVKKKAIERPELKAFVNFYLHQDNSKLVSEVGYIPLTDAIQQKAQTRFDNQKTGSVFQGGATVGVKLEEVL